MDQTFKEALEIAKLKGEDYTKGSANALANFKEAGDMVGVDPLKICLIFANKHYSAIQNYVKTGGQSESEPIDMRIKDMINYLVFILALIEENELNAD
jgi:hypothetical protein